MTALLPLVVLAGGMPAVFAAQAGAAHLRWFRDEDRALAAENDATQPAYDAEIAALRAERAAANRT